MRYDYPKPEKIQFNTPRPSDDVETFKFSNGQRTESYNQNEIQQEEYKQPQYNDIITSSPPQRPAFTPMNMKYQSIQSSQYNNPYIGNYGNYQNGNLVNRPYSLIGYQQQGQAQQFNGNPNRPYPTGVNQQYQTRPTPYRQNPYYPYYPPNPQSSPPQSSNGFLSSANRPFGGQISNFINNFQQNGGPLGNVGGQFTKALEDISKFDDLQCVPKLLCQMIGNPRGQSNLPSYLNAPTLTA